MKHNIRQRVINEFGLPVTKIVSVNGELGSDLFDKYGREIFEGDIISNGTDNLPVKFCNGALLAFKNGEGITLYQHFTDGFEIIGHVDD